MKKFLFLFFFLLCSNVYANEQSVCGKTFMFFYNEVNYLMKFSNPIEDLPCTSGTATLYWFNKTFNYSFSIDSNGFVKVNNIGNMVYFKDQLFIKSNDPKDELAKKILIMSVQNEVKTLGICEDVK